MKQKVAALIEKLQELKDEDAALSEIAQYTKLLYAELMYAKSENEKQNQNPSRKKVSVIMPGYDRKQEHIITDVPEKEVSSYPESVDKEASVLSSNTGKVEPESSGSANQSVLWDEPEEDTQVAEKENEASPRKQVAPLGKELNDWIAQQRPSLNDQLKVEQIELGNKLSSVPIKDLHNGIGLNDKFAFINELFRGDQSLYNRSIKTINECRSLDDALYWIDRELKIKLGWQEKDKTVQQFYHLIRKRFS